MKVLGIIASARRFGNSEIAVKEVLLGAKELGADVEIVRLTDMEIKPCTGCMRCVFKGERCHIKDDAEKIFDKMVSADALVLGVPDYILGAAGILKMLLDRATGYLYKNRKLLMGKPAVAVIPFGVKGWEGLTEPMVTIFLLALGYRIVDRFMVNCQGPGEILFDEKALKRCFEAGKLIASGVKEYKGEQGVCPVCHSNILEIKGLEVMCPICEIKGHIIIENGKLGVKFEDPENNRWTEKNMILHFEENILPSAPRYLKRKDEIKKRLERYKW